MPRRTVISGTITCRETGTSTRLEHYLYPAKSRMTSILQVIHAELYEHADVYEPFQISVEELALDAIGNDIELLSFFQTLKRKCITSPSFTTYSLPSSLINPFSLAPASPLQAI